MRYLTMPEIERLRVCDDSPSPHISLLTWLRRARRREILSEDSHGFFLSAAQVLYWDDRKARARK